MKMCDLPPGFRSLVHSSGGRMEPECVKNVVLIATFLPRVQHDTKNTQHLR